MKLLTLILDFLFPPSKEALKLRSLSPEEINRELPPAPASPYHYINSLFAYKDPLASELIWSIKYKRDKHAIKCGGFALYKALENKQAVLVPIPVSKERRKERGYNQCELLVDEMVRISEGKLEKRFDILSRIKHAERQTLKNRRERLEGVEKIFHAEVVAIDLPIIIIDDVTTTGSTIREARDTLLNAGYANITAITLAH